MRQLPREKEAGMTLLEGMIALSILVVAFLFLLQASAQLQRNELRLIRHVKAVWIADSIINMMTSIGPGNGLVFGNNWNAFHDPASGLYVGTWMNLTTTTPNPPVSGLTYSPPFKPWITDMQSYNDLAPTVLSIPSSPSVYCVNFENFGAWGTQLNTSGCQTIAEATNLMSTEDHFEPLPVLGILTNASLAVQVSLQYIVVPQAPGNAASAVTQIVTRAYPYQ